MAKCPGVVASLESLRYFKYNLARFTLTFLDGFLPVYQFHVTLTSLLFCPV